MSVMISRQGVISAIMDVLWEDGYAPFVHGDESKYELDEVQAMAEQIANNILGDQDFGESDDAVRFRKIAELEHVNCKGVMVQAYRNNNCVGSAYFKAPNVGTPKLYPSVLEALRAAIDAC